MLAAEWNFGDFFLGVLVVFAWVVLFWFVIMVLIDIFRRRDINGWVKALWVIFVVLLPWLGVLVYLITQHEGWAQRNTPRSGAASGTSSGKPLASVSLTSSTSSTG